MLSPKGNGLFQAGIAQSGSMLTAHGFLKNRTTERESQKLKEVLKCGGDYSVRKSIFCLQSLSVEEILKASIQAFNFLLEVDQELEGIRAPNLFYPVEDHYAKDPFLPILPLQNLVQMNSKDIPFMAGVTAQEGAYVIGRVLDRLEEFDEKFQFWVAKILFGVNADEISQEQKELATNGLRA